MQTVGRRRQADLHLPPRVYIKGGAYYFVHLNNKWQRLAKVGEEKEMRRQWAVLADPDGHESNVSALLDDYLVLYAKIHKAPRTYKDNCTEAEYLKSYFGQMRPQDVLPRHVGAYLDINKDQRAVRANREKALLSHVFSWAMRHDIWGTIVVGNPCKGVHRNPEQPRARIVEDYEYEGVYDLAPRNVQRLMTLVYRTLQRPSDLLKIGPRNMIIRPIKKVDRKILKIKQSKTGNEVEIFVTQDIEDVIANEGNVIYPTFIHTEKLTKGRDVGKAYTYTGLRSMFTRALDKWRNNVEKETGVRPTPFGIYDLKGKGATDMFRNGTPLETIQVLCGHDSITTTEIYIKSLMIDPVMPNERVMDSAKKSSNN
jgi:integrase